MTRSARPAMSTGTAPGLYSRYARRYARLVTMPTTAPSAARTLSDVDRVRQHAAPLPARAARRRRGRPGGARRLARHPFDQDDRQGVRHRPRHLDGRPDDAGRRGHPGQGPGARRQGDPPRPDRPHGPRARPRSASTPTWWPPPRRPLGGSGVNVASVATAFPAGRAALDVKLADIRDAVAGRRRRDRHGHRPRRVPRRPLPGGVRRDRRRQRGLRRRPARPQGHLRDRRAVRRTTTSAGPAGSAMLAGADFIKTSTGKVAVNATPAEHPADAGGRPRLPRRRPASQVGVKPAGGIRTTKDADQVPRHGQRDRGPGLARPPTGSASAPPRC